MSVVCVIVVTVMINGAIGEYKLSVENYPSDDYFEILFKLSHSLINMDLF